MNRPRVNTSQPALRSQLGYPHLPVSPPTHSVLLFELPGDVLHGSGCSTQDRAAIVV